MSNKTLSILLILSIGLIGILFLFNLSAGSGAKGPDKFVSPNGVQGVVIEHNGKEYTLNFQQQNAFINSINRAVSIPKTEEKNIRKVPFPYGTVTIFRFEKPPVKINPVGFINQQIILDIPEFNAQGLIRETGPGEIHPQLLQTYDP